MTATPETTNALTDRATVLAEAIAALEQVRDKTDVNVAVYPRYDERQKSALDAGISELRRLAGEAQQEPSDENVVEAHHLALSFALGQPAREARQEPTLDGEDTFAPWLAQRFDPQGAPWDGMSDDDRSYWEHQARAVRRAVERGGFKWREPQG